MVVTHHVFLIPGFFGFTHLGEMGYWEHTRSFLGRAMARHGATAQIHRVTIAPTASLQTRARELAEQIAATSMGDEDLIYLVGHSTGGLDARLVMAPNVQLRTGADLDRYAAKTRAVVTVATPHHGAPLASSFNSLMGQQLLQVLSLATIYILRFGHLPLSALFKLSGLLVLVDGSLNLNQTLLMQIHDQLLEDFTHERRGQLQNFFRQVEEDRSLVAQLTPACMDLFETTVIDRPGVRYGCVVTRAARPGLRAAFDVGFSPYSQAMYALYQALYRLSGGLPNWVIGEVEESSVRGLREFYGAEVDLDDSDGIVPTLSQLHGDLITATEADHLDIIGHFEDPGHKPPHYDWLITKSGFTRDGFEKVWDAVARYLLEIPPS